tara:strand:- start:12 stop:788 length:777 start_codon:yes stop_codon:yes gene_type:complete
VTRLSPLPAALFGGAARWRPLLPQWQREISTPLSTARRIGVISLGAGAGATTLTRHLVRIVAAARGDRVLAVDAAADGALAAHWRLHPDRARTAPPRTSAEATAHLARVLEGARGLAPAAAATDPVGAWLDEAAPISRFFDVVVTDFGRRHPATDLAPCAALGDTVLLVADADRASAEGAVSLGPGLSALPESPRVVVALVDRGGTGTAGRIVAARKETSVSVIPHDGDLTRDAAPRRFATRVALLGLGADLMAGDRS